MGFSSKCILREPCRNADTDVCNALCGSFIALHGHNGEGGRVGSSGIPRDYRNLTLANSPAADSQTETYALIQRYVTTFTRQFSAEKENIGRIKSLYLVSSSPGTGKTTTAAALLNEYLIVHYIGSVRRGRQPAEKPTYFLDVNEWQTEYNTFNRAKVPDHIAQPAADRYYRKLNVAQHVPFLVMDDIGVRDGSEAFRADLHAIVNRRVVEALPTVYTSNVPITELEYVFDRRLADRVRDMCVEVAFAGESNRGIRK